MPVPSSLTLNYDAVISSFLFNYKATMEDAISKESKLLWALMKLQEGGYEKVSDLGERISIPLMYELTTADSYSGYDDLPVDPIDGISRAFYDWRQAAIPISISGKEEKMNMGTETKALDLLKAKTTQATMGMQDFVNRGILLGNAGSDIVSPRVSINNGSLFVEPIAKLVKFDPTSSTVIGNINQATYTWWRNKFTNSAATTFAAFLQELRHMNNECSKGPGGAPNFHICDQNTIEYYELCLADKHRNTSYTKADIPFDAIAFRGNPLVWDELMPNVKDGTDSPSTTKGSWFMLNTKFFKFLVHKGTDFAATPMAKPVGQDAKVSHILLLCGLVCSNRRKQGVIAGIDTTKVA